MVGQVNRWCQRKTYTYVECQRDDVIFVNEINIYGRESKFGGPQLPVRTGMNTSTRYSSGVGDKTLTLIIAKEAHRRRWQWQAHYNYTSVLNHI